MKSFKGLVTSVGLSLAILALLSSFLPLAQAQITTSSLTGSVTDQTGAAIPGAKVTVKEVGTGFSRTVLTGNLGEYSITAIPAGTYDIRVEMPGFQTIELTNQAVPQQQAVRLDFVMKVGGVTEVANVEAKAPLLQTETPANSITLSERRITQLPTIGRSYLSTAILSPGAVPTVSSSILTVVAGQGLTGGATFKPVSVNASGGPPDFVAFIEDGFDVRDPIYGGNLYQPSVEAITSFRVVRGFDTAQHGGEPSVLYVSTKSGTNEYHGSVYHFHQDAALTARTVPALTKPALTYNKGGFALGGPVLPQLKNKTFIFGSFEFTRMRSGSVLRGIVPTEAEWRGDLSSFPVQIYNPFDIDPSTNTRRPFPGNIIPSNLLSPFAQRYKQFVPLPNEPNAPFGQPNLTTIGTQLNDDTQYLIRVDQMLPRGGTLFAKYFRDKINAVSFGLSRFAGTAQPLRGQTASIEWDQPTSKRLVNQLRIGFFRSVTDFGAVPTKEDIAGKVLGLKNVSSDPLFFGLPSVGVTGLTVPGTLLFNLHRLTTRLGISENLTYLRGRHTMDLGFRFEPTQYPQKNGIFPRGQLSYGGGFTSQRPGGPGGAGLADFLLGALSSASGNPTGFQPLLDTRYWAWHVQDQIKATKKLTLTLGLRWDYWEPPRERYNRWVAFDQERGRLVFALKDPLRFMEDFRTLSGDIPRGLFLNWKKRNFSPRFGFAYLLTPQTTVRGGYGIYYSQGMANFQLFSSLGFGGPPFVNNSTVTNDTSQLTPRTLDTQIFPAPAIGGLTPGTIFVTQDIHAPQAYVQQITFSVERQVGKDILLSAGYNGTLGRHLMDTFNINQARPFDPQNPLPLDQRRPYPFFSDILLQSNSANSSYNGMYVHFQKHYSHGVDFVASYTWSKAIDLFSSDSSGWQNQDARRRFLDRALADFDRRHYFSIGYVWDLPFGPKHRFLHEGPLSQIVGNWRFSGISQFLSGQPLSPAMPTFWPNVAATFTKARPDRVCNGNISNRTLDRFFDTNCLVRPPANSFGNAGRNIITGPGAQLWDMSLAKEFDFRERARLEFRADFFSIFNHQNWGLPDTGVLNPSFGKIFTKSNPRRIQFGLRLQF